MNSCFSLDRAKWQGAFEGVQSQKACEALENGQVLYAPKLVFALNAAEATYLRPDCVAANIKSIKYSLAGDRLWGASEAEKDSPVLKAMMKRYAEYSRDLITALFPNYAPSLKVGNASFRPVEVEGRAQSKRHDDSLLHVDAFPSRPNAGKRILRVFSNVHPGDRVRVWRVGEPFPDVAARFMPKISAPIPGSATLLKLFHLTKGTRTPYDHYMNKLHDAMKYDAVYQINARQETVFFAPQSSWIVFTDQVSHAAMSGQHALEQTFELPVEAMARPETSPLRVLEQVRGRGLI